MNRYHLALLLSTFWANALYCMEQTKKKDDIDKWFHLQKRRYTYVTLPATNTYQVSSRSIERLSSQLKSSLSEKEQLNILSKILRHTITTAEELQEDNHPDFITTMLSLRGLKKYLEQYADTFIFPDNTERISKLEQYWEENYTLNMCKKPKSPPIQTAESELKKFKIWRATFPSEQLIKHQIQAFRFESEAKKYWKEKKIEQAQEKFSQAVDNLIQQAKLELQDNNKNLAAPTLFKARILLTHFDNSSARKKVFLELIKDINKDLEPVKIKNP